MGDLNEIQAARAMELDHTRLIKSKKKAGLKVFISVENFRVWMIKKGINKALEVVSIEILYFYYHFFFLHLWISQYILWSIIHPDPISLMFLSTLKIFYLSRVPWTIMLTRTTIWPGQWNISLQYNTCLN